MKSFNSASLLPDPLSSSCLISLLVTTSLICGVFFVGSAWLGGEDAFVLSPRFGLQEARKYTKLEDFEDLPKVNTSEDMILEKCNECRPVGSEALPKGIVSTTSNFEMIPLSGPTSDHAASMHRKSLLALSVGIKQRILVNQIVTKFLEDDFAVILFHYDGIVNEWNVEWSEQVVHISAVNQTKWWFAKRFLHPDIVAEYEYIFLWDEDLGVEYFHPASYVSIVKEEGLEISQPALDPRKSEVHHQITVRRTRSRVHRRYYKFTGGARCYANSTAPPCVGWVEMMAPVFSRAAWRCVWYMIQNDLIHAWGLDKQLGYCAQGDRTLKVGVVDKEYVLHFGLPTLGAVGVPNENKATDEPSLQPADAKNSSDSEPPAKDQTSDRSTVRFRSHKEMLIFRSRWSKAAEEDECWMDPFEQI